MSSPSETDVAYADHVNAEEEFLKEGFNSEQCQELYRKLAQGGRYDKMMLQGAQNYRALDEMCRAMEDLFPQSSRAGLRVLDVGAGTGLSGDRLQQIGFSNIDGLEPQPDLAQVAEDKNIYRNMYRVFIGGSSDTGISDDSYDVITTVGTFLPGHIPCDALPEMIRIVKPGGHIVICMREEFMEKAADYKDKLQPLMSQLEGEGRWRKVRWERYPNHYDHKSGLLIVFCVC